MSLSSSFSFPFTLGKNPAMKKALSLGFRSTNRRGKSQVDLNNLRRLNQDFITTMSQVAPRQCDILKVELPKSQLLKFDLVPKGRPWYSSGKEEQFDSDTWVPNLEQTEGSEPSADKNQKSFTYLYSNPVVLETFCRKNEDLVPADLTQRTMKQIKAEVFKQIAVHLGGQDNFEIDWDEDAYCFTMKNLLSTSPDFIVRTANFDRPDDFYQEELGIDSDRVLELDVVHRAGDDEFQQLFSNDDLVVMLEHRLKEIIRYFKSKVKNGNKAAIENQLGIRVQNLGRENYFVDPESTSDQPADWEILEKVEVDVSNALLEYSSSAQAFSKKLREQIPKIMEIIDKVCEAEEPVNFELYFTPSNISSVYLGSWLRYQNLMSEPTELEF